MDKVKIKANIVEVEDLVNELVSEGKLDGDQAQQIIFKFTVEEINREFYPPEEV